MIRIQQELAQLLTGAPADARVTLLHVEEHVLEWDPARSDGRMASGNTFRAIGNDPMLKPSQYGGPADPLIQATVRALAERVAQKASKVGPIQALLVRASTSRTAIGTPASTQLETESRIELYLRIETARGALLESWGAPLSRLLDPEAISDSLAARLSASAEPLLAPDPIEPDLRLPMRLSPAVAAPLVAALGTLLRADVAIASGLSRNLGKRVFPAAFCVDDFPEHALGTRVRKSDDEGSLSEKVTLIDEGKLAALLHTSTTAQESKLPPNGRAFYADGPRPSPAALNLHVRALGGSLPADYLDVTTRIETFTPSPRTGHVSITVAGREVRGGQPGAHLRPFELELPVLATLRRVAATGTELTFFPAFDGVGCPWILLGSSG